MQLAPQPRLADAGTGASQSSGSRSDFAVSVDIALIKMSSLGDMVHTLPALTDAAAHGHRFHWIAEEAFVELPRHHPGVVSVLPIAIRRWRRQLWQTREERHRFRVGLRELPVERAIDAQGLIKSAIVGRWLSGVGVAGFDRHSIREPLASLSYRWRYAVPKQQHAVTRVRQLFAQALEYPLPESAPDFAIARPLDSAVDPVVFGFHGTTWPSKLWPVERWRQLAQHLMSQALRLLLPWGNEAERAQAQRIAEGMSGVEVLPAMTLGQLLVRLRHATAAVGVDSGLIHAASAFGLPTVALYGVTDPALTAVAGDRATILRASPPSTSLDGNRKRVRHAERYQSPWVDGLEADRVFDALIERLSG